jgi:hypothetical protein
MTRTSFAPIGWALMIVAASPMAVTRGLAQDSAAATGIRDQFAITLPEGWNVYDQNAAISGKPGALGMVFFSAQPLTSPGATTADAQLLAKADTGELATFFVERTAADKGMTCAKLSRNAIYDIGTRINQDRVIASVGNKLFGGGLAPKHKDNDLGGCHGVKYLIDAHKDDPARHWTVDVRAVSDGKVLYLFSLRNRAEYFARNLEAFDRAMATVRFTSPK